MPDASTEAAPRVETAAETAIPVALGVIALLAGTIFLWQYGEKVNLSASVSLLDVLTGAILLTLVGLLVTQRRIRFAPYQVAFGLFLAGTLPAVFRTEPPLMALSPFGKYALFLLLSLAAASAVGSVGDVVMSCRLLFLSSLVPVAYAMYELLLGQGVIQQGYHMPTGGYHHPGIFAYSLLFLVPVCLFLMDTEFAAREQWVWAVVFLALAILIILTFRRNVWVGLLFVLVGRNALKKKWLTLMAIPAVLLALVVASPAFRTRLGDFFNLGEKVLAGESILVPANDPLFSGRFGVIRANLVEFRDAPTAVNILGGGFERTVINSARHGITIGGHNIYLILLIDCGLLGLSLYALAHALMAALAIRLYLSPVHFIHAFGTMSLILIGLFLLVGLGTHISYNLIPGVFIYGIVGGLMVAMWGVDAKLRLARWQLCLKSHAKHS